MNRINLIGKVFEFDGGQHKVIAQKDMNIVVLESVTDDILTGDIEILINASINNENGSIKGSKSYYFGITKSDFYNKIKEKINGVTEKSGLFGLKKTHIAPIDVNNTKALVDALHKDYYKIPAEYLELVVTAYQNNM